MEPPSTILKDTNAADPASEVPLRNHSITLSQPFRTFGSRTVVLLPIHAL